MADDQQAVAANRTPHAGEDFFVVGIGASAGGVAPLRDFFARVRADSGFAYVVISHLSPDHESSLPALIQSQTSVPVSQVTESVRVEPNHIYVIPPSKYLMLMDGSIRLTEPERPRGGHTSIDLFFRTLADAYGKHAIAIVLSGTGADGSLGLGRIKEEGGFAIAQDPSEAEYSDMPRNAIDSGHVDMVLRVAEIPPKLLALQEGVRHLQLPDQEEPESPGQVEEAALRNILTLMRVRTGNDFTHYKRPTLLRRIARRMQVREQREMRDYAASLREDSDEITALQRDLLITVTNFFRDRDAFEQLAREVIPDVFAGKGPRDTVRVWSAGCATGEEAYSLAMLLSEYASDLDTPPAIQVFASDIDERAIAEAREGRYPATISLDVSSDRLRRFFIRDGDRYQVCKELRDIVLFAVHNVVRDPPFSKLDLISCRNLLIYLNRPMQDRILELFHFALRPDGSLILGSAESADAAPHLFAPLNQKRRIYIRRRTIGVDAAPTLMTSNPQIKIPEARGYGAGGSDAISAGQLHQEVVERFSPPSVLVNEDYDVLHISANAGRFLRVPAGEPTRNLLRLVDPSLRPEVRAALIEAGNRNPSDAPEPRYLTFELDGQKRSVNLTVRSVGASQSANGCYLVILEELGEAGSLPKADGPAPSGDHDDVRQLEHELQRTKDQLRITVEHYETSMEELHASNEELQAINEELRSATEELETSKEELQSVNEELTTINQEYKEKIEELGHANSDLQNLMSSTDIGTIFLNRALQIKRYTPRAQQLFNITGADIGRPLEHFTHKLDYTTLTEDAEGVLFTLQPIERELESVDHKWYLLRLAPYRTTDDRIDGVVLTFVDLTARKEAEEQLRRQAETLGEQAAILNLGHVLVVDFEWRILSWNTGCESLYGFSRDEALGKFDYALLQTEYSEPRDAISAQLERTGEWQGELAQRTRSGERIIVASHLIRHQRAGGDSWVILEVNNDVTARRQAEDALREADHNKDQFLAILAHELRNPLGAMLSAVALLRTQAASPDSVRTARGVLERQLERLTRLVDDLLDSERLTRGKISLAHTPVRLSEIFEAALETCRGMLEHSGRNINVVQPPIPLYVDGDNLRLSQVVANLVHNALKYSPPDSKVDLIGERDGQHAVIRVRDKGIGIAPELLPRIFDMYSQEERASNGEQRGLGIGLAIAKQLTEMHGGTVAAHSGGLGRGSEFVVRLPLTNAPLAASAMSSDDSPSTGLQRKRVLIVDDSRDLADVTAMVLRAEGHQVRAVNDPQEALAAAAEFKPQVAVLDIGLPGMDGYALASRMRAQLPAVVLIALSGWRQNDDDPRAAEAGFRHYLTKPFDPEKLAQMIAETEPERIKPE